MSEFRLPSLGSDMEDATIVEWKVKPGDRVKRGDILLAVETYKGIIDVETFEEGVIEAIRVPAGEKAAVGTVLAIITGADTGKAPAAAAAPPAAPHSQLSAEAPGDRIRASPAARKRAAELGVALAQVKGGGADGAITLEDVEKSAGKTGEADGMRSVIAAAMARSKREIPHYYLGTSIDLGRAMDWLAQRNQSRPVTERLLYSALLIKAVALALQRTPELNGFWRGGRFEPGQGIHVGVAVSLRRGGLVAPAVHDADRRDLDDLMRALQDLVTRARSGRLRASEMAESTITVTNLGERGVESVYPVIYPPQVAMVGFGAIVRKAVVKEDGAIEARPVIHASLAADHRVSDGHRGGLFLTDIATRLQAPEAL